MSWNFRLVRQASNQARPLEREETAANLDAVDHATQRARELERSISGFDVKGD